MEAHPETVIIYNPYAGNLLRRGTRRLSRAKEILERDGYRPRLVPTQGRGTGGAVARQAISEGAQLIVAAGGDGTINEVLQGMLHSTVPLGILPAGTANVLANEMGVASRLEAAAAQLLGCQPRRISVGRLHCSNGSMATRHFLLMAGIGLDAHIVYNVSPPIKAKVGKVAYGIAGFSMLGRQLEEFQVELEGRVMRCSFALVSKVRNYGGDFEIARDTSLLDDRFEVVLFEGRNSFRYLKYLAGVVAGRLKGMRGVSIFRSSQVCISAPADSRVYIQVDGEYAGHLPGSMEIVPDALTLLIPEGYLRKFGDPLVTGKRN